MLDLFDDAPESKRKLQQLLHTSSKALLLELAVTTDTREPSVKACYKPEGDGQLAFQIYEVISSIKTAIQVCP